VAQCTIGFKVALVWWQRGEDPTVSHRGYRFLGPFLDQILIAPHHLMHQTRNSLKNHPFSLHFFLWKLG